MKETMAKVVFALVTAWYISPCLL